MELLREVDDHRGLLHLLLDLPGQGLALVVDKLVGRKLDLEIGQDLVDGPLDHVQVQLKEGRLVAHPLALLPEEQVLPEADRVLVYILEEVTVLRARELVVRELLLGQGIIFVEELEELFLLLN